MCLCHCTSHTYPGLEFGVLNPQKPQVSLGLVARVSPELRPLSRCFSVHTIHAPRHSDRQHTYIALARPACLAHGHPLVITYFARPHFDDLIP